jgi:hypothetical protein
MPKKQDDTLKFNHRFSSAELKASFEARAKEEGRKLTEHMNELAKADAKKLKTKVKS